MIKGRMTKGKKRVGDKERERKVGEEIREEMKKERKQDEE